MIRKYKNIIFIALAAYLLYTWYLKRNTPEDPDVEDPDEDDDEDDDDPVDDDDDDPVVDDDSDEQPNKNVTSRPLYVKEETSKTITGNERKISSRYISRSAI